MIYYILSGAYLISGIAIMAISLRIYDFWRRIPHLEGTQIIYWTLWGFLFISAGFILSSLSALIHQSSIFWERILMAMGGSLFVIGLIFFMIGSFKSMNFILKLIS